MTIIRRTVRSLLRGSFALAGVVVIAVVAASCSSVRSPALTVNGKVLAFGSNNHGQLGRAAPAYATTPVTVELPEQAQGVAAGMYFSLALGRSGRVYAWGWNRQGQLGTADPGDHLREMLELLLFTVPGERIDRPDFGCGLLDLVFAPNSPELAAVARGGALAAVNRWLGDVLTVQSLDVVSEDATLRVSIAYTPSATGVTQSANFTAGV